GPFTFARQRAKFRRRSSCCAFVRGGGWNPYAGPANASTVTAIPAASHDRTVPAQSGVFTTGNLPQPTPTRRRILTMREGGPGAWLGVLVAILLVARTAPAREAATPTAGEWLDSIRVSAELQEFLDRTIDGLLARDARLRAAKVRVALLDLAHGEPPRLAHYHGDAPIYPASVVKFVYLMAAYRWQELDRLRIEGDFDHELSEMIRQSSNQATRRVFARLTDTEPGPELSPEAYRDFRERRLAVKHWLARLGIQDLPCVNPPHD